MHIIRACMGISEQMIDQTNLKGGCMHIIRCMLSLLWRFLPLIFLQERPAGKYVRTTLVHAGQASIYIQYTVNADYQPLRAILFHWYRYKMEQYLKEITDH